MCAGVFRSTLHVAIEHWPMVSRGLLSQLSVLLSDLASLLKCFTRAPAPNLVDPRAHLSGSRSRGP